jgi:hypothetical protein
MLCRVGTARHLSPQLVRPRLRRMTVVPRRRD